MKKALTIAGLLFLFALSSGCAQFGAYMKDRGNDFADCFKFDVGLIGAGFEAHARVTDAFVTGVGIGGAFKLGFKGRSLSEPWFDEHVGLPFSPLFWFFPNSEAGRPFPITYFGLVGDAGCEVLTGRVRGIPGSYEVESIVFYPVALEKEPEKDLVGQPVRVGEKLSCRPHGRPFEKNLINSFDIEVGGTLGLFLCLSGHVGFSPGQFLDFLLGWFGPDIGNDDAPKPIFK